jgi:ABC-2 type transport system ATP-binding protein
MTAHGYTVEVENLSKKFGSLTAVDNLSFTVPTGRVTGFLGPNGAGKTTTLRMLLGLVRPTLGRATIGGKTYAELTDPLRTVGASLEATGFHPGRSARDHLRVQASVARIPVSRVDEVLLQVGLTESARRRVGGFSLGMRQRLALATALLGDPPVLLLDEPANGLDPEGIAWLRGFLRFLAQEGRTVLVSSHVLSEVQQTVDDVVIIARGRLIRHSPLAELETVRTCLVRTPHSGRLLETLAREGIAAGTVEDGLIRVTESDPARIGAVAFGAGVELHELRAESSDLEAIFLALVSEAQGVAGNGPGSPAPPPVGPSMPAPSFSSEQEAPR